jgi:hypothetical protein
VLRYPQVELNNSTYFLGKTSPNQEKFMHKLIQTIALGAVVLSPLSLISLATAAAAHHTSSHVTTVATTTTQTKPKMKKGKKTTTNGVIKKKPAAIDPTTTQPETSTPSGETTPMKVKPAMPDTTMPSSKINPNGAGVNGSLKPNTNIKVPTSGTNIPTTTPGGVADPAGGSMSKPSVPSVPSIPSVPTGLPK